MKGPTIFGREPAFWIGLLEACLVMVLSFNQLGLTQATIGAIMAVVTGALGFYTAYVTKQTLLGVGVGLAKSVLVLGTTFGLALTENQTAAIISVVTLGLGAFNRTQAEVVPRGQHRLDVAA